jgi:glutamate dehydrogenase
MIAAQSLRLLQGGGGRAIAEAVDFYGPGIAQISAKADGMITAFSKKRLGVRTAELVKAGAPKALAEQVAALELLGGAIDVVEVAARLKREVTDVAANYFAAGARFGLDWLRSVARQIKPADHWERIALGRLMADLRAQQSAIGAAALELKGAKPGPAGIAKWAEANAETAERADRLIAELQSGGPLSIAKLAVASSQLKTS